jgi:muramidase (phage lysozyme)
MDPLMAKQAAINGLTDEWLDAHQISYDLRRKYANEIQASNALNLPSKKDQEKAIRNLIRNDASPAPDGTTAPLVNLIEADLVNMWRSKTREYIQQGADPADASERAVKFVMAHFEANSGQDNPSGLYYKNPEKASEYTNYKNELGKRGVKAENVTQRYHNLERLLKVYDGDFNNLIKSGQLFSKPDLEKINTIMERDPFLLSIDKNSPLFVRVQQAKALLTRNNPNLPFPKLLERTYDLMDMPVPPALQEIGPKLEQLTPSQNRFLNKLFVDGNVSQNQISRAITPISSVPLRPGKEYALSQTGMAGLRGLTRSGEGGYTSMFPSESYPQLTNMTIRQVVEFQKAKLKDGRASAAVGAYQFLYPETAAQRAGLSLDDKFTPENQDRMFDATLTKKRPKVGAYLSGKSDDIEAALDELAKEFASFEYRGGRSYYSDGVNKASIMRTKAAAALKSARQEMMRGGS